MNENLKGKKGWSGKILTRSFRRGQDLVWYKILVIAFISAVVGIIGFGTFPAGSVKPLLGEDTIAQHRFWSQVENKSILPGIESFLQRSTPKKTDKPKGSALDDTVASTQTATDTKPPPIVDNDKQSRKFQRPLLAAIIFLVLFIPILRWLDFSSGQIAISLLPLILYPTLPIVAAINGGQLNHPSLESMLSLVFPLFSITGFTNIFYHTRMPALSIALLVLVLYFVVGLSNLSILAIVIIVCILCIAIHIVRENASILVDLSKNNDCWKIAIKATLLWLVIPAVLVSIFFVSDFTFSRIVFSAVFKYPFFEQELTSNEKELIKSSFQFPYFSQDETVILHIEEVAESELVQLNSAPTYFSKLLTHALNFLPYPSERVESAKHQNYSKIFDGEKKSDSGDVNNWKAFESYVKSGKVDTNPTGENWSPIIDNQVAQYATERFLSVRSQIRKKLIDELLKTQITLFKKAIEREREILKGKADAAVDEGTLKVPELHDMLFPPAHRVPALSIPSCRWYQVSCRIKRHIKKKIRAAYEDARNRSLINCMEESGELSVITKDAANKISSNADEALSAGFNTLQNELRQNLVDSLFNVLSLLQIVTLSVLLFMLIKSWFYIFARVAFRINTKNYAVFERRQEEDSLETIPTITPSRIIGKYILPKDTGVVYYSCDENPTRADKTAFPQPLNVFFRRLFLGKLLMRKLDTKEGGKPKSIEFTVGEGRSFLQWEIPESETVIISLANLSIMSENVTLSTRVSFRMSSLLLGQIFFTTATPIEGKGTLVFNTSGNVGTKGIPASPDRLLVCHKNTEFSIDAYNSFINVFLSPYNLVPKNSEWCSMDLNRRARMGGLLRSVGLSFRGLFLPF